jgi:hypothetical protein
MSEDRCPACVEAGVTDEACSWCATIRSRIDRIDARCDVCQSVRTGDGPCKWCMVLQEATEAPRSFHALETQRANRCADAAGKMRHERDELLKENAMLRREVERLERKSRR